MRRRNFINTRLEENATPIYVEYPYPEFDPDKTYYYFLAVLQDVGKEDGPYSESLKRLLRYNAEEFIPKAYWDKIKVWYYSNQEGDPLHVRNEFWWAYNLPDGLGRDYLIGRKKSI